MRFQVVAWSVPSQSLIRISRLKNLATKFEAHPFLSAVLQDDIAFWIWVLVAGQLVSGVAVAVFTIVYISWRSRRRIVHRIRFKDRRC
jgi:hypothetical protein